MTDVVFENLWDCPSCGTKGISAFKQKKCPQCGYSKTAQEEEYLGQPLTKAEDLAVAGKFKDWTCSSCGSVNKGKAKTCENCGNPKESDDHVNTVIDYGASAPHSADEAHHRSHPRPVIADVDIDAPAPSSYRSSRSVAYSDTPQKTILGLRPDQVKIGGISLAVLAVIVLVLFGIFHTRTLKGTVSAFSWSRDIPIETYKDVRHTHESSHPGDAYNVRSYQESRQVPVYRTKVTHHPKTCTTTKNNGDGTSTQSTYDCSYDTSEQVIDHYDTVWDTYYDYDRNEWVYERTEHAGANDHNPHWPEFNLNLKGQTALGAERQGTPSEEYKVVFTTYDKDEKRTDYTYTTNLAEWQSYEMEGSYPLEINSFGSIMNDPLADKNKVVPTKQP